MFPSEVQHVVDLQQFVSRATFSLSSFDILLQDNMQLNPQVIWLSLINIAWLHAELLRRINSVFFIDVTHKYAF